VVDFEDGCRLISAFVEYSNTHRLHSAIGYLTPVDKLNGREALISRQREDKKKYIEETIERKRSHIKNVPLSSLSGIRKPGTPAGLN
jgi:putative transposase